MDDRIGEFLLRNNAIDRAAFEMAVKVAKDTRKRFGKTIVEMGHMSAEEMETQVPGKSKPSFTPCFCGSRETGN